MLNDHTQQAGSFELARTNNSGEAEVSYTKRSHATGVPLDFLPPICQKRKGILLLGGLLNGVAGGVSSHDSIPWRTLTILLLVHFQYLINNIMRGLESGAKDQVLGEQHRGFVGHVG